ncbi:MAG: NAD(P)-dependent oxidoreductase [Pirellulales bacterium]|nr:NAD(P)-dependent oxidoreductase [Pirellulales bacterium]
MRVALTGATGFLGRYILRQLHHGGHSCRAWHRTTSDLSAIEEFADWLPGELGDADACRRLVKDCDAVIHSALAHKPGRFHGGEGDDLVDFAARNVGGSLQLIEAARAADVPRFVFISTCAVHDVILDDRPLDEAHPTWAMSHYGAHKAAIEQFVHSYGFGHGYDICALRPCGIYGVAHPPEASKWYDLVSAVARGETVTCNRGGKEVHAADVASATELLLTAAGIAGQSYNCCDMYVSQWDVAHLARDICGAGGEILGQQTRPKNQIDTSKLEALGFEFGGEERLRATIKQLLEKV